MAFCDCQGTLSNTGLTSQQNIAEVSQSLIFVPLFASDGTRNEIDIADVIDAAYITARLNDTDKTKRWYPVGRFKNVEDLRADSVVETFTDGANAVIRQGTRTFTGLLLDREATYLGKLEPIACNNVGVFLIDSCGSLVGSVSSDGQKLRPVAIEDETFNAILVKKTDSAKQRIQINFDYALIEQDKNLKMILSSEITAELLNISGLLDAICTISAPTTTSFTVDLNYCFGSFQNKIPVEGWVIGDFSLFNNTTVSSITITSVTESSAGVYDFVIPAQTGSDSLTLSGSKTGFEMADCTFTV